ncbi:SDR family NAD(P)-dependent oxidoreductase [Sphingomonas crocodyli]|uniref:SDR family NAD(P)-dependent oxidoreductase n=1 Tax=Sphingomonas crocodyli TaxID=1979270 RepID=A0A437M8G9_9SPHN|nr:SDR family NAD(P)-dependent oxidoreductase [Sphingomonas crocodyli]RVT94011.1 SDR family NAD(P)-dependent oxidoreductase [Sphingomonas crocodyli]
MEKLEFHGRAAVITGAGSGIGRALAHEAVSRGMAVAIADINAEGLEETAEALRQRQAKVVSQVVDVRSAEAVEEFAKACFDAFPSIAAVYANAGIIRYQETPRLDLEKFKFTIDVNLYGVVHMLHSFVGRMMDRGEPAQFVATGSQASFVVAPEIAAYAASKHGVWALAETLNMELTAQNSPVRASMLAPPRVATGIVATTVGRVRDAQGEKAADDFFASLMPPEFVAKLTMDKTEARELYILPDTTYQGMFNDRIAPLVA